MLPAGSSGRDAQVGLRLGEMEDVGAIREHGRRGLARVELSFVDLGDVRHEVRLDAARLPQQLGEPRQQLVVADRPE